MAQLERAEMVDAGRSMSDRTTADGVVNFWPTCQFEQPLARLLDEVRDATVMQLDEIDAIVRETLSPHLSHTTEHAQT